MDLFHKMERAQGTASESIISGLCEALGGDTLLSVEQQQSAERIHRRTITLFEGISDPPLYSAEDHINEPSELEIGEALHEMQERSELYCTALLTMTDFDELFDQNRVRCWDLPSLGKRLPPHFRVALYQCLIPYIKDMDLVIHNDGEGHIPSVKTMEDILKTVPDHMTSQLLCGAGGRWPLQADWDLSMDQTPIPTASGSASLPWEMFRDQCHILNSRISWALSNTTLTKGHAVVLSDLFREYWYEERPPSKTVLESYLAAKRPEIESGSQRAETNAANSSDPVQAIRLGRATRKLEALAELEAVVAASQE